MTRARATALTLVNWKGVFYERYLLDPNVTALEGANGAGKTTVMIAAYVVLMPDMSRLRFTNLGESGATGGDKGIWGRLGEAGSPSYAVLELELHGGVRLVAGVELVRKSEPGVELHPFLITGLSPSQRLQDLLLLRHDGVDEVPARPELAANAQRQGAALHSFGSAKDYFAALFEHGVSPLRLSQDEDRNKFNEMLRTSMTGGISRALTSELRSFLLREENGLGDTLLRMRKNLDACRRTRVEVSEAQRLEHEITGIYEAGQGMFQAALLATREEAREAERALDEARTAEFELARQRTDLDRESAQQSAHHASLRLRLELQRDELKRALESQARLGHTRALVLERSALESERQPRDERASVSRTELARATTERAERLKRRDRARLDYERSARGLADIQEGLDELHRNAHRERRAKSLLAEVRALLGEPEFMAADVASCSDRVQAMLSRIDHERLRLARDAELLVLRRDEHDKATRALSAIIAQPCSDLGYERAQRELGRLRGLDELATLGPALSATLQETELLAVRQVNARRRARELGFAPGEALTSETVAHALRDSEIELRAVEELSRDTLLSRANALAERAGAELELSDLERRSACRKAAYAVLSKLEPGSAPWSFERAQELDLRLRAAYDELKLKARAGQRERETQLREASELELQRGSVSAELMRWCDEFDAEPLIGRFEDIDPGLAPGLEARLGPLLNALIVNEPLAVAERLVGRPRELETVWLVAADSEFLVTELEPALTDVVVNHGHGARVTRLPARSILGRRARLLRAQALREGAESIAARLDADERHCQRLELSLRELAPIVRDEAVIGGPRLTPLRDARQARLQRLLERLRELELEAQGTARRRAELEPRLTSLRALLIDAFLLDGRDHSEAYRELSKRFLEGEAAARELSRVREARVTLESTLQALRFPLGEPQARSGSKSQRENLDRERDRCFKIVELLGELGTLSGYFESSAEPRATKTVALVPALQEQYEAARVALDDSERALEIAEAAREQATLVWQQVEAERAALNSQCARLDAELTRVGVGDFAGFDLRSHDQTYAELSSEAEQCDREEREVSMNLALLAERRRELGRSAERALSAIEAAEQNAQPSLLAWQTLSRRVNEDRLSASAHAPKALLDAPAPHPSPELWASARSKCELLLERLSASHGAAELLLSLQNLLGEHSRGLSVMTYYEAWLELRQWLGGRVPAQVADVQDPLEALERLRDHLFGLERRLARQESDLRGASEDIARSIEVQLRRAGSQVRRLNQSLEPMHFGSIQGIRVKAERVERMGLVLGALRDGDAQELLFQPTLPLEDALNEVFRRYAGGRSGGHRILDYREYLELSVEIKRQSGDSWELANPTRLSTGEAIGVGAALMMVVLSEWERDANLLRGKREHGSLRFLFLDEANRLSPDNLGVLFDLCQSLELQLLIAAPEVARADGNTTYRLVRTMNEGGREEVVVSGRRAALPISSQRSAAPEPAFQGAFEFES